MKMISNFVLEKLKEYFTQREDINAVYLFGSTVKNRERNNSDLDLAVLFKKGADQYRRFQTKLQVANDLEDLTGLKIDVVDLGSADLLFIHQVMKNKMLLFERNTHDRVTFEVKYRKEYFDFMPVYDQYYRQARQRLKEREAWLMVEQAVIVRLLAQLEEYLRDLDEVKTKYALNDYKIVLK